MSSTNEKQELDNLLKTAKTFKESELLEDTIPISGKLRKSRNSDSIILIPDDPETWGSQVIEIEKADVVRHEVINESFGDDKTVRIHVRGDALLTVSSKILAKSTLNSPFVLATPQLAPTGYIKPGGGTDRWTGSRRGSGHWDQLDV